MKKLQALDIELLENVVAPIYSAPETLMPFPSGIPFPGLGSVAGGILVALT
ncbi:MULTISPECIES: hypothetical protein [Saccharibacillus]|uniref:Uncharacterized protein n=1 Tax=Saccharibacillus endophyticus TaxID=2060666 RepID=A0ABQ1ZXY4_9BACL|nr:MULTISPECIES: hypothetical protein [Saccharibacillus]GGH82089.1 hypothetical protein GCM10007362_32880 [Saccharibacillus endophyticus]